jgi:hypothetical protein
MGSPYSSAKVSISGGYLPGAEGLTDSTFQDKAAVSEDGEVCFLIEWTSARNEPAFRVWRISNLEKTITKSAVIQGCCVEVKSLNDGSGVSLTVWQFPAGERQEVVVSFPN